MLVSYAKFNYKFFVIFESIFCKDKLLSAFLNNLRDIIPKNCEKFENLLLLLSILYRNSNAYFYHKPKNQFNKMSILKEFKEFAMRGNVIDLAVGVTIGGAFGKIVTSVVNDIIMPPIGYVLGGTKFTDLVITLKAAVMEAEVIKEPAVTINYGNFIQVIIDFLIIALIIFMMIKTINSVQRKKDEIPAAPTEPTDEVKLLGEIRDLLKKQ
jgi:large conductance mechanosensitive channel